MIAVSVWQSSSDFRRSLLLKTAATRELNCFGSKSDKP